MSWTELITDQLIDKEISSLASGVEIAKSESPQPTFGYHPGKVTEMYGQPVSSIGQSTGAASVRNGASQGLPAV
jgi:hypothetical protein